MSARETHDFDVLVLGGGIAGLSAGAHLASARRVAVLEREATLGYHTTGRSSAMFAPSYGGASVQPLTAASAAFFEDPPAHFKSMLIEPRAILHVAARAQLERLDALAAAATHPAQFERLSARAARQAWPGLRARVAGALVERVAGDLNVDGLMQGFAARILASAGAIATDIGESDISRARGAWRVHTARAIYRAPVLVNAAGAWADDVARQAGAAPKRLAPLRRTVVLVDPPIDAGFRQRPVVFDVDEHFYFRPFGKRLLITLADETPSAPCDAAPDEEDVARTVARYESVVDQTITSVSARWAGLRTFAPDRAPVIGPDPQAPDFFWVAGLGGFGIQTAPAVGALAARLIEGRALGAHLRRFAVKPALFDPGRAALAGPAPRPPPPPPRLPVPTRAVETGARSAVAGKSA